MPKALLRCHAVVDSCSRRPALFQLNEDDLEDLENERRVDVEIAREMRARESSEGDDFLPSDGDEL